MQHKEVKKPSSKQIILSLPRKQNLKLHMQIIDFLTKGFLKPLLLMSQIQLQYLYQLRLNLW
uniref:Neurospora crassa ATPase proteolipid like gene and unidentified reading frame on complementary strand n=1 Tax=Neurospora crassa TaxID=5141 RepID=V9H0Z9_NEUCS|nr:hypothetical protein [imported] - Neurospora crassa [Neurospora crassa]CAA24040.1 unnamed protein product [Neurospora crassa]prf//0808299B ATPase subunit [Neurospora crassa]